MSDRYMLWTKPEACNHCGPKPWELVRVTGESSLAGLLRDARAAADRTVAVRHIPAGPTIAYLMPPGIQWDAAKLGPLPGVGVFHRDHFKSPEDEFERATIKGD